MEENTIDLLAISSLHTMEDDTPPQKRGSHLCESVESLRHPAHNLTCQSIEIRNLSLPKQRLEEFLSTRLTSFDYHPRTRLIFGSGTIDRLSAAAQELGGSNILLVTDSGLKAAGHEDRAIASLEDAGLSFVLFDNVTSNPTTEDVERGLDIARDAQIDLIVGLGGGSSMDCAKGINFLLTNGGKISDYVGIGKATKPMLPMIAVPTTAGTGSEAQSFALIADPETHMKMACGDKKAACRIAILDPELTASMPASVTATTGIDAISHAVETFVTKPRTPLSQMFSREAWQLLSSSFSTVLNDPGDIEARGNMLLGAHWAGSAIENSMLGATHALANPLSAKYDMIHGIAIGIMLPHVIRYNGSEVGEWYGILAADSGLCDADSPKVTECLAGYLQDMVESTGSPTTLAECHVKEEDLPELAAMAAQQWTGEFNPRTVDSKSFEEIYRCAY